MAGRMSKTATASAPPPKSKGIGGRLMHAVGNGFGKFKAQLMGASAPYEAASEAARIRTAGDLGPAQLAQYQIKLRRIARQLVRNDGIMRNAYQSLGQAVVGTGPMPRTKFRDGRPSEALGLVLKIVVADDEILRAVELVEDPARLLGRGTVCEIAEMVDDVIRSDDGVPGVDEGAIVLVDVAEGALAHREDGLVAEVGVGGEIRRHRVSPVDDMLSVESKFREKSRFALDKEQIS